MNLGLVTSYIIGGLLLLAMLMLQSNMAASSAELTLTQLSREKVATLTDMINYDLPKIGANRTMPTEDMIVEADSSRISFYSNIDVFSTSDHSVEQVTWELTDIPLPATPNPDDRVLRRRVKYEDGTVQTTDITLGVTRFLIRYYSTHGADRADYMPTPVTGAALEAIRQLDVQIMIQSPEKVYRNRNSDGMFVKSVWEERFSPANLQN